MRLPHHTDQTDTISDWICVEILPFERNARRWLERTRLPVEADDVIQEAYARIAAMGSLAHIRSGRAYFLTTVRNIALQHLRRSKVVRMDSFADIPAGELLDDRPGPEAITGSKLEIEQLLLSLPERCQAIFRLVRLEGYTQRETSELLGISENVVEKQVAKAMEVLTTRFGRESANR